MGQPEGVAGVDELPMFMGCRRDSRMPNEVTREHLQQNAVKHKRYYSRYFPHPLSVHYVCC